MKYAKNGLTLDLPDGLKIKSDAPGFLAMSRRQKETLLIEIDPAPSRRAALEDLIAEPLGNNPELEFREFDSPSPANLKVLGQRAVEEVRDGRVVDVCWALNLEIDGVFVHVQMSTAGSFESTFGEWERVLQSISLVSARK